MRRTGGSLDGERPAKRLRLDKRADQPQIIPLLIEQEKQGPVLPLEVWLMILERLADKADLQRVNRVCKQIHELINANYYLWHSLHWQKKDYDFLYKTLDEELPRERTFELINGDIAVFLTDGSFCILPVMEDDWRYFAGHTDPDNFHIASPIKYIIALQHHQLATCAEDGIRIWNRNTGALVQHLPPQHPQDKPCKLLVTKHNHLVSASPEGSIYLYRCDGSPAMRFEYESEFERGELKNFLIWDDEIVAEFSEAIVSWNQRGKAPTTRIIIRELQKKLMEQMRQLFASQEFMASGQVSDNDCIYFASSDNQGLEFAWRFFFWNSQVEVILNKTFSFVIDLFSTKLPLFLGVIYKRYAANDFQGNYFIMHNFERGSYRICSDWSSQQGILNYPLEIVVPEPVKLFFLTTTGKAFFLLSDNRVMWWNIKTNTVDYVDLSVPDGSPDMADFFQYGNDEWEIFQLVGEVLMGVHSQGQIIIWDMCSGRCQGLDSLVCW